MGYVDYWVMLGRLDSVPCSTCREGQHGDLPEMLSSEWPA